ncbi:MAG: hypothetical protein N3A53_03265 [Verrucomicrobiae bacterium]|nr:hypothetical protein [Verrucomicrobiae bacterium]
MIPIDYAAAIVLYVAAYLGLVFVCWCRYEWHRVRRRGWKSAQTKRRT